MPRGPDFVGTTALLKRSIVLVVQFQLLKLGVDLVVLTLLSYSFIESAVPPPSLFSPLVIICVSAYLLTTTIQASFLGDFKFLQETV